MSHKKHEHRQQFLEVVYAELEKVRDKVATEHNQHLDDEVWAAECTHIAKEIAKVEDHITAQIYPPRERGIWGILTNGSYWNDDVHFDNPLDNRVPREKQFTQSETGILINVLELGKKMISDPSSVHAHYGDLNNVHAVVHRLLHELQPLVEKREHVMN